MASYYPATGFHFQVTLGNPLDKLGYDTQFQSVSGLQAQIETESIKEGGQNNFEHVVPTRRKYPDLILKRGIVIGQESEIMKWCQASFVGGEIGREIVPRDLLITLLNPGHAPLMVWNVIHAWPKSWKFSDLNADKGEILIETIELNYNEFTVVKHTENKKLKKLLDKFSSQK